MVYSLFAADSTGVFNYSLDRIIVDDAEFTTMNLEPCTCVGAHENKVPFPTPRPTWEPCGVLIAIWPYFYDKKNRCE
jgi:hypothetical protein